MAQDDQRVAMYMALTGFSEAKIRSILNRAKKEYVQESGSDAIRPEALDEALVRISRENGMTVDELLGKTIELAKILAKSNASSERIAKSHKAQN